MKWLMTMVDTVADAMVDVLSATTIGAMVDAASPSGIVYYLFL